MGLVLKYFNTKKLAKKECEDMKREKIASICFLVSSIIFYLVSCVGFINHIERSLSIMCLCFGSFMLCLGAIYHKK